MAWEENPRICLHMQLIAILSRTGVLYEVSVRQVRCLPPVSFRFQLTMDTLAIGYTIPAIRAC